MHTRKLYLEAYRLYRLIHGYLRPGSREMYYAQLDYMVVVNEMAVTNAYRTFEVYHYGESK